jgi:lactam utilization protein B
MTINCDMGEGFGLYQLGDDEAIMPFTLNTMKTAI